jgi:hypothetical protein
MLPPTCRAHFNRGSCRERDRRRRGSTPALGFRLVLVRLLLFLALATIAGAFGFYLFKRDRRYLRFIGQVVKYTIFLMLAILVFYAFERLVVTV